MPVEHPRMTGISDPGYNPRFNAQKKKRREEFHLASALC
jgi:hypothetical protein